MLTSREEGSWKWVASHSRWIFLALVVANIALKAPFLNGASLFLDEAVAIFETQGSVGATIEFSAKDPTPPFYYVLLGLWCKIFGISEFSARFPSMLFSAVTAGMIFLIGQRFSSTRTGLYAALIFTLSNIVIVFSHEARAYALASMLMSFSYYAFLALVNAKQRHWRPALVLLVVNALLLYTHYLTSMGIAAQAMLSIWMLRGRIKGFLHYIASQVLVLFAWLPWLMMNRSRIPDSKVTSWLTPPSWMTLKNDFADFAGTRELALLASLLLLSAGIVVAIRYIRRRPPTENGFSLMTYAFWFIGATGLQVLISYLYMPVFGVRYALYALPGGCLLLGTLVASLPISGIVRNAIVLIYLGLACYGLNINPQKPEEWREAVTHIKAMQDSKTGMVINAYYQYIPFTYYYNTTYFKEPESTPFFLADDHIHCGMDSLIVPVIDDSLITNVILVLSHDQLVDPDGTLIDFMNRRYCLSSRFDFAGIKLLQYKNRPCSQFSGGHFEWDYEAMRDTTEGGRFVPDPSGELGNQVTLVSPTEEFSATYMLKASDVFNGNFNEGEIKCRAYAKDVNKKITLVVVMEHNGESYNWSGFDMNPQLKVGEWGDFSVRFKLLDIKDPTDKIKFYFWTDQQGECYFDDLVIDFWGS